ncbi:hypothetical protein C0584_02785 [Candidatus Parcubacteria bacterium]|nr:MAG: hypothetical protein C0584_02785 [Candidatus Parcubacteria bacterium]
MGENLAQTEKITKVDLIEIMEMLEEIEVGLYVEIRIRQVERKHWVIVFGVKDFARDLFLASIKDGMLSKWSSVIKIQH